MEHPIDFIGPSEVDEFCNLLKDAKAFDELEIKIIKAMLEIKQNRNVLKCSANDISRAANISVTNTYKYLYSLQERGLVESLKTEEIKNKLFWLSGSTNPFPRLLSRIAKDYIKKKELFFEIEKMYKKLKPNNNVWQGEKVYEHYEGNFPDKAAMLIDMAKDEVLITADRFFEDFIVLDSLKRASTRGVKILFILEEVHPETSAKLKDIGIDIKIGYGWPYIILADNSHGLTVDKNERGVWFLNQRTDFKQKFMDFWEKADKV